MGHKALLKQLREQISLRGSQKQAADVLGISESGMSRKLRDEVPLTLEEFLKLTEAFGIDLHQLTDSAGFLSGEPFSWGILNTLGEERCDESIVSLSKRMIRRLEAAIPEDGFNFTPTPDFYRVERLQRSSRHEFRHRVDTLRDEFFEKNRRRHKYRVSDLQALAEILDLSARRHVDSTPLANFFLRLALELPVHFRSLLRLYTDEFASQLLQQTLPKHAEQYIRRSLANAYTIADDTLTARLLLLLSLNQNQQGNHATSIAANRRVLGLSHIHEPLFTYRAFYNLAVELKTQGQHQEALKSINSIPIEDIQDDPQFVFDILWLGGDVRIYHGDQTGITMMLTALKHRPHQQKPLNLLLLLEELVPLLSRTILLEEAAAIAPYIRKLHSPEAMAVAQKFLDSLKKQGPFYPLGPALSRLCPTEFK